MTTEINNMGGGSGDSSASTVLIAVVVVILIGLAIWFFGFRGPAGAPANTGGSADINVTLPAGGDSGTSGGAAQ